MDGFDTKERRSVDCTRLQTLTILGDEIPSEAFNYGVNSHQIKLRLNSALIFTVTATSEGLFVPLEGCLCHLGCDYHRIALVLGTILRTIDCVYLQLPGGNSTLAELKASQSEQ